MRINPHPSRITTRTKTKERKKNGRAISESSIADCFSFMKHGPNHGYKICETTWKIKMGCTNKRRTVTARGHSGCLARDGTLLFSRISSFLLFSKENSPSPFLLPSCQPSAFFFSLFLPERDQPTSLPSLFPPLIGEASALKYGLLAREKDTDKR